eukprot:1393036-Amorphochlora_amoeboformis.AAC.1
MRRFDLSTWDNEGERESDEERDIYIVESRGKWSGREREDEHKGKELERSEKVPKERQAVLDAIFVAITKADDETVEHMAFHQNASPVD